MNTNQKLLAAASIVALVASICFFRVHPLSVGIPLAVIGVLSALRVVVDRDVFWKMTMVVIAGGILAGGLYWWVMVSPV